MRRYSRNILQWNKNDIKSSKTTIGAYYWLNRFVLIVSGQASDKMMTWRMRLKRWGCASNSMVLEEQSVHSQITILTDMVNHSYVEP